MTAAKRFTDEERAELAELMREAIRAELGVRKVDEPKPAAVRREPSAQAYADVMARRRRRGR